MLTSFFPQSLFLHGTIIFLMNIVSIEMSDITLNIDIEEIAVDSLKQDAKMDYYLHHF